MMKLEALMIRTNPEETEGNVQEVIQPLGVAEYESHWGGPPQFRGEEMTPFGEDGWVIPGTVPNADGIILYFEEYHG